MIPFAELPPSFQKAANRLALSLAGLPLTPGERGLILARWYLDAERRIAELLPRAPAEHVSIMAGVLVDAIVARHQQIEGGQHGRA